MAGFCPASAFSLIGLTVAHSPVRIAKLLAGFIVTLLQLATPRLKALTTLRWMLRAIFEMTVLPP